MGIAYAVLGSGRQGTAAAYDFASRGDADTLVLADLNLETAQAAAKRVNSLSGERIAKPTKVDVTKREAVLRLLKDADVLLSAVPYKFNLDLARLAVKAKASMVDLGGNTAIVQKQLALDARAKEAGVALVPDCGMGPGANVTLAVHAIRMLDEASEVRVYDGGLLKEPSPPWHFALTFHFDGLANEYSGSATFLRDRHRVEVPALSEPEDLVIPPFGRLEAAVTSGGLSTMPWTYEGKLRVLENKTLRYPGHWERMQAFAELGLFSDEPVSIGGRRIVPREVLRAFLEPQITRKEVNDVAVIRVVARGRKSGRESTAIVDLLDAYDEDTGFTAMERVTGWHAAIVAEMVARGEVQPGAHSVESGVPPKRFVEEAKRRGIPITERLA